MAGRFSSRMGSTALSGVLAAGSLTVLWLASAAPSGQLGLTAVAGLFPVGAVLASGRRAGYLCWAASAILGLLVLPNKGVALLYASFLGGYPVLKSRLESGTHRLVEWGVKLLCFNGMLTLLWMLFQGLLLPAVPPWLEGRTWLLYLLGNPVFILYDIGLSRLITMLMTRIR